MLSTYEELLKFLNLLEPLDSKLLFPSDLFYESIYFLFNKDLYFFFYVQTLLCNYPVILAFLIIFYLYLILILTSFVDTYIMPITKNYRKHFFFYGFLATIYLEIAFLFCFIISLICFLWLFILFKIYIYSYFFNDFTYLNILLSLKVIFCFLQNYILFTIKKFFFSSQIFLYLNFFYKIFLILLSVLLAIPSTLYTLFYNFFFLPLFFNYISYLFLFFFKTIQYLFFNNTILVFLGFFFFFFFFETFIFFSLIFSFYFLFLPTFLSFFIVFFFKFLYDLSNHDINFLEKSVEVFIYFHNKIVSLFPYYLKIFYFQSFFFIYSFIDYVIYIYKYIIYYIILYPILSFDDNLEEIQFWIGMAVYLFFISGLTSIEKTFFEPEFLPQLHLFYFEEYIFDNLLPKVIALSRFFAEDIITIYKLEELAKFHQKNPAICLKEALESLYAIYNFNFGLCSLVLFSYVSIIFPTICVYCAAITLSWTWFLYPLEYLNVTNLRKLVNRDDPRTYSQLIFYDSYIFLKNLLLDYNEFFFLEFKFFKNLNFFKANFIFNFKQFFKNKNKKNFLIFITHIYNMKNLIHDLAFDILLIKKYLLKLYNKYYTKVIKYTCASTDIESINFSSLEAVQTILYFTYYIAFIPPTGVILLELYLNSSYSNEINSFFFDCFPIFFFFFLTLLFYLYYVSQGSAYLVYLSIKLKLFVCYTFLYTLFLNIQKICRYLKKNLVTNFNINVILKDSYDLINKFIQPVLEIHKKDTLFDIDNVIMYTIAIPGFYIRDFFIAKVLTTDVLSEVTNDLGSFMNRTRLGPLGFFYPRVIEKLGESFTYRAYIFFRRGRLYKKDRIEEKKVTYLIENGWFIQKNSLLSILEVFFINYRVKLNLYIDFKDDLEDAFITMNKNYFKFLFKNFTNIKDAFAKIQKSKTYKAYSYKKDPEGLEAFIYFGNRIPILIEMYCGYHILSLTSSLEIILNELLHFDTKKFNANLKLKNKEKELKKKHEEIKKKQGNYIDYDLFTTLENLSISEKKTKNLPVNDKILRCIQYQSFLYIDDDSLGIFPNKKQDNNVTLNKEFLITIADKIIQFFSIDLGENDYESIKKKRLEKFEYYTNFKFLPILKKKIKNITYAYDTQYKYKKPYKIPFLKSDYNVLLNIALFFNNLPKNNINNKNHLSMDVDFLDDGTMIAYFITPETTAFFKDLEKKKKLKIDRQYYHIILFFTSLGVIFFSSYITEPVVVLDGVGTVIDWDIYVNTW